MKETIKVGIPTNSRINDDLTPLLKDLYMIYDRNIAYTPMFPEAEFCSLRIRDIARLLRDGIFNLGILCDDIALDEELDESEVTKVFSLNLGDVTTLSLLIREEQRNLFKNAAPEGIILTTYPNAIRKLIGKFPEFNFSNIDIDDSFEGQLESVLRNEYIPNTIGVADVVRSGGTAKSFGLVRALDFMTSRMGVWKLPSNNEKIEKATEGVLRRIFGLRNGCTSSLQKCLPL